MGWPSDSEPGSGPEPQKTRAKPAEPQPKKLYRIGEVSRLTGVNPHVLRYWERELPQLTPNRTLSKQRYYRLADIERIRLVKRLLAEERYTLEGVRKVLGAPTFKGATPEESHHTQELPPRDWQVLLREIIATLKEIRDSLE